MVHEYTNHVFTRFSVVSSEIVSVCRTSVINLRVWCSSL